MPDNKHSESPAANNQTAKSPTGPDNTKTDGEPVVKIESEVELSKLKINPLFKLDERSPAFEALVEDVRKHGIKEPISVRLLEDGQYEVLDGARRVAAAKKAGNQTIKAVALNLPNKLADKAKANVNMQSSPSLPDSKPDAKAVSTTEVKKPDEAAKAPDPKAAPAPEVKKPDEAAKAPDPKATPAPEVKKPAKTAKAPDPKAAPASEVKKPAEAAKAPDPKAAPASEVKKPAEAAKAPDPKAAPAPEVKKPAEAAKAPDPKAAPAPEVKKPAEAAKAPDPKAAPVPEVKKPAEAAKAPDPKAAPAPEVKKPAEAAKAPDPKAAPAPEVKKPAEVAKAPDTKASPAKEPPKGVKITQVFSDRLDKPDDKALKAIPIPKEGEGYSMRLHPDYFFDFLDHPFTINREVDDYKELFDSIKANGINEPVKARPREGGGLELLSGHRRHDIAKQLNYPVPVVIVQMDDDSARIEVVDGNLHRQDIPTSELARAAKMKMEALARKAGRRSKMDMLAGPSKRTDQIVAEDMGMSRNQVNRLVRIDSLVPELKQQVDDKKLPFNTAVELSYLKPDEQSKVVSFIKSMGTVPTMAQATELKEASRAAQEAEKAAKAEQAKAPYKTPSPPTPASKPAAVKPPPAPVDEKKIAAIITPDKPKAAPEQKYIFTSGELKEYFPNTRLPTISEVKRKVFNALDLQRKMEERDKAKQAIKDGIKGR